MKPLSMLGGLIVFGIFFSYVIKRLKGGFGKNDSGSASPDNKKDEDTKDNTSKTPEYIKVELDKLKKEVKEKESQRLALLKLLYVQLGKQSISDVESNKKAKIFFLAYYDYILDILISRIFLEGRIPDSRTDSFGYKKEKNDLVFIEKNLEKFDEFFKELTKNKNQFTKEVRKQLEDYPAPDKTIKELLEYIQKLLRFLRGNTSINIKKLEDLQEVKEELYKYLIVIDSCFSDIVDNIDCISILLHSNEGFRLKIETYKEYIQSHSEEIKKVVSQKSETVIDKHIQNSIKVNFNDNTFTITSNYELKSQEIKPTLDRSWLDYTKYKINRRYSEIDFIKFGLREEIPGESSLKFTYNSTSFELNKNQKSFSPKPALTSTPLEIKITLSGTFTKKPKIKYTIGNSTSDVELEITTISPIKAELDTTNPSQIKLTITNQKDKDINFEIITANNLTFKYQEENNKEIEIKDSKFTKRLTSDSFSFNIIISPNQLQEDTTIKFKATIDKKSYESNEILILKSTAQTPAPVQQAPSSAQQAPAKPSTPSPTEFQLQAEADAIYITSTNKISGEILIEIINPPNNLKLFPDTNPSYFLIQEDNVYLSIGITKEDSTYKSSITPDSNSKTIKIPISENKLENNEEIQLKINNQEYKLNVPPLVFKQDSFKIKEPLIILSSKKSKKLTQNRYTGSFTLTAQRQGKFKISFDGIKENTPAGGAPQTQIGNKNFLTKVKIGDTEFINEKFQEIDIAVGEIIFTFEAETVPPYEPIILNVEKPFQKITLDKISISIRFEKEYEIEQGKTAPCIIIEGAPADAKVKFNNKKTKRDIQGGIFDISETFTKKKIPQTLTVTIYESLKPKKKLAKKTFKICIDCKILYEGEECPNNSSHKQSPPPPNST